jgi:hypothetical protein
LPLGERALAFVRSTTGNDVRLRGVAVGSGEGARLEMADIEGFCCSQREDRSYEV